MTLPLIEGVAKKTAMTNKADQTRPTSVYHSTMNNIPYTQFNDNNEHDVVSSILKKNTIHHPVPCELALQKPCDDRLYVKYCGANVLKCHIIVFLFHSVFREVDHSILFSYRCI